MSTVQNQRQTRRILVVDDDHLVADTLALIFQKNGFEALATYSGEGALECLPGFSPDLLLCDITMPGMDGLKLVQQVSRQLPSCRIIVLTGFYSNVEPVRHQSQKLSHPVGIFMKPCQPTELLRQAKSLLAST
jgi:CheY-like chemotaxis protein